MSTLTVCAHMLRGVCRSNENIKYNLQNLILHEIKMAGCQDGDYTFAKIMPRKCKHRKFRLDEAQNDSDVSAQFKIGSKNVLRWLKIKQKMGFNNNIEFAEYLLTLAEGSCASDSNLTNTIQPMVPPPNEEPAPADCSTVEDLDVSKCEPLISLVMECDEH